MADLERIRQIYQNAKENKQIPTREEIAECGLIPIGEIWEKLLSSDHLDLPTRIALFKNTLTERRRRIQEINQIIKPD